MKKSWGILSVLCVIALMGTGCSNDKEEKTIELATKPMTEQFILSEMLKLLIEDRTDITVNITKGVGGGTANIHPALEKGDFDLYPEYTSTGYLYVMKKEEMISSEQMWNELQAAYHDMGLKWVGQYGFNNTYGLVLQKDIAAQYDIKTYSDLIKLNGELTFGAEPDFFEREDGYNGLNSTYGLTFKKGIDMDIGLKYDAFKSKKVDIMNIFTTDGQLSVVDGLVLEDNLNFYPSYYCATVVRVDTLAKYPELESVLLLMENILTDSEMAALNYEVEGNGRQDLEVAREFLVSKGLIK